MSSLLLLPFRGLWLLISGVFMSLPILIIIGLFKINTIAPVVIQKYISYKTGFNCVINGYKIDLIKGHVVAEDVFFTNPKDFKSSDCFKIKNLEFYIPITSMFGESIKLKSLKMTFTEFRFTTSYKINNIQLLVDKLSNFVCSRLSGIEELEVGIDGIVGTRYYINDMAQVSDQKIKKNFSYTNVICNDNADKVKADKGSIKLSEVYKRIISDVFGQ